VLERCVGDVDVFADEHWGRRPLLRRGAGDFRDLLDIDAIEHLLATAPRRPTFRLVRDGATLDPARSTGAIRLAGRTVDDVADPARVRAEVAAGATLVLQALQRTWLPLVLFCRGLEREISHPVQANAYLTPAGAAGLAEHADEHDVLVLQLEGSKRWCVAGLGGDVELRAGDVLYLPAGTRHAAAAQAERSLHLTIGILRVTYRDVVERALPRLDRPLPLGFGHDAGAAAFAAGLRAALDEAAAGLAAADAAAVAAAEQSRAGRRRRPLGLGALRSVLEADAVDADTVVARPADVPARVELPSSSDADAKVVVHLLDRTVRIPAVGAKAVDIALAGAPVRVGDLPELDEESRVTVARRLVREGALVVVPSTPDYRGRTSDHVGTA
jgi:uncharacterized RmlC-like cupin family protein